MLTKFIFGFKRLSFRTVLYLCGATLVVFCGIPLIWMLFTSILIASIESAQQEDLTITNEEEMHSRRQPEPLCGHVFANLLYHDNH